MGFQVHALDAKQFEKLNGLDADALAKLGVERYSVDENPGFPCRVSLVDAEIGESVLLLNYEHQPADTPYRSSHAIFVREGATTARPGPNEVPQQLRIRKLAVRAFDAIGNMLNAEVIDGEYLAEFVEQGFEGNDSVDYFHVHNAARGCYLATICRIATDA